MGSEMCIRDSHLTFRHRAGVRPYTSSFDLAESCVFDKQSPGPFHCGHAETWRPFSRSYGSILPSSLAMNLSSSLEYSSQLPVSVCGTGCFSCFSWDYLLVFASPEGYAQRGFPSPRKHLGNPSLLVRAGTEILICCPSTTPFGFVLGPD